MSSKESLLKEIKALKRSDVIRLYNRLSGGKAPKTSTKKNVLRMIETIISSEEGQQAYNTIRKEFIETEVGRFIDPKKEGVGGKSDETIIVSDPSGFALRETIKEEVGKFSSKKPAKLISKYISTSKKLSQNQELKQENEAKQEGNEPGPDADNLPRGNVRFNLDSSKKQEGSYFGEIHLPGYNFVGPFTQLWDRLIRGDQPINDLDKIALEHDLYFTSNNEYIRRYADEQFIKKANKVTGISAPIAKEFIRIRKKASEFLSKSPTKQDEEALKFFKFHTKPYIGYILTGRRDADVIEEMRQIFDITNEEIASGLTEEDIKKLNRHIGEKTKESEIKESEIKEIETKEFETKESDEEKRPIEIRTAQLDETTNANYQDDDGNPDTNAYVREQIDQLQGDALIRTDKERDNSLIRFERFGYVSSNHVYDGNENNLLYLGRQFKKDMRFGIGQFKKEKLFVPKDVTKYENQRKLKTNNIPTIYEETPILQDSKQLMHTLNAPYEKPIRRYQITSRNIKNYVNKIEHPTIIMTRQGIRRV